MLFKCSPKVAMLLVVLCILEACNTAPNEIAELKPNKSADSLLLTEMIAFREKAMIEKDLDGAMAQFAENATWINSQGYYFEGKQHVSKFHQMLVKNDTVDYYYEAGEPKIRILDAQNAIAYYSWKMFWYKKDNPADTTFKEIGLMTLTAQKERNNWKWVAITNQHTPWFLRKSFTSVDRLNIQRWLRQTQKITNPS